MKEKLEDLGYLLIALAFVASSAYSLYGALQMTGAILEARR